MAEINRPKLIEYLMVIYTIFITDSMLFATNSNHTFIVFKRYFTVLMAMIYLSLKIKRHNNKKNGIILLLAFCLVISMIMAGEVLGYLYITQIAVFVFAICYCLKTDRNVYARCFVDVLRVVAIVSLIVYFFPSFFSSLSFIPRIINTAGVEYKFYLITNSPINAAYWKRNLGPFWEPGAYQLYCNLALLFTLFSYRGGRRKYFDALLFTFTCITTKSGASFVGIVLIVIAYLLTNNRIENNKAKYALIIVLGFGLLYFLSTDGYNRAVEKVFNGLESTDNTSYGYRLSAAITYLQGFARSPLWGNSSAYLEALMKSNTYSLIGIYGSGNTNTILSYFAYYGVIVGAIVIVNLYKSMKSLSSNRISAVVLLMAIVAITSNENFMCSTTLCVVVFSSLMSDYRNEYIDSYQEKSEMLIN